MYRIIKTDGTVLGITEKVNYIKIGAGGCYTPAKKEDAIGVAYNSVPYNLLGHDEIHNADTVLLSEIDGGAEVYGLASVVYILLGGE